MKKLAAILFLFASSTFAQTTTLTGTFRAPNGNLISGSMKFELPVPGTSSGVVVMPQPVTFRISNGVFRGTPKVYGNDVIVPSGTFYRVTFSDDFGRPVFSANYVLTGSPVDMSTAVPTSITTSNITYFNVPTLGGNNVFTGNNTFTGTNTFTNLILLSANIPQTGATPAQIGGLWWPGTATGFVTPPSAAPVVPTSATGGTIADGSYKVCITYVNRNGETPCSPPTTVTLSGATSSIVFAAENDTNWQTGAFAERVYVSSDGGTTYWRQTPTVVATDFMWDTTAHYIKMGSGVQKTIQSLVTSGTNPPTTNTAVIDPLQVALNATRRVSDRVPFGTLVVPAIQDAGVDTRTLLTTPLIMRQQDHIIGSSSMAGLVDQQSRIVVFPAWGGANDNKLAAVMNFGGDASISNVGIQGIGTNALMVLCGVGNQCSGGTSVQNVSLRVSDTTNTYSAFVAVGVLYDLHFDHVGMVGGNALIQYRNAAGGLHYYTGGRWDASGDHFINMVPGWTDPDNGTNDGAFPNGLDRVVVKNVRTEGGKGILWDVMGVNLTLDTVEVADALVQAGTAAIIRMGTDSTITQVNGSRLTLINTSGGSSSNAAAGVKVNAGLSNNQTFITVEGDSGFPVGASGVGVDASNIGLVLTNLTSSTFTANPNASGAAVKMINVPNSSRIVGGGGGSGLAADGGQWFELPDRLVLNYHAGNNAWDRSQRRSWRNVSGTLNLYASDDTTVTHSWNALGDATMTRFLSVGANSPTGAAVGTSGIGLGSGKAIWTRNNANSANMFVLFTNASDQLELGTDAGIASIKLTKNISSSANGGFVNLSTSGNITDSGSLNIGGGQAISKHISTTAALDFANQTAIGCNDLTVTATDAALGDVVTLGVPNASVPNGTALFSAWVSAPNTVTVRYCNLMSGDPASGTFRVDVWQH
jgi:hypothetical protein